MVALGTLIEGLILGRIWGLLGMGGTTTHGLGGGVGGGCRVGGGLRSSFEVECQLHTTRGMCSVMSSLRFQVYAFAYTDIVIHSDIFLYFLTI